MRAYFETERRRINETYAELGPDLLEAEEAVLDDPVMSPPTPDRSNALEVEPVSRGLYRERRKGLVIKMDSDHKFICIGQMPDPKSGEIIRLTPELVEYCRVYDLSIDETSKQAHVALNC